MARIVCKIFCAFTSLLTAPPVKNSYILAGIYFIFLKKSPLQKSKVCQYQSWTSVKKIEKLVFKYSKFQHFFCKVVALILG